MDEWLIFTSGTSVSVAGFSELRLQGSEGAVPEAQRGVSVAGFSELRLQGRHCQLHAGRGVFQLLVSLN